MIRVVAAAPNAVCDTAEPVTAGSYSLDLTDVSASPVTLDAPLLDSGNTLTLGAGQSRALWYSYTAPSDTTNKVELSVQLCPGDYSRAIFFDECGMVTGLTGGGGCNSNAFGSPLYLAAGQSTKIAIGYNYGFTMQETIIVTTQGTFEVMATPVNAWIETEHDDGDAGSALATTQIVVGENAVLDRIVSRIHLLATG